MAEEAKKSRKEDVEKEILKEVESEIKGGPKKEKAGKLRKVTEAIKKDVAEEPEKEAQKAKPKKKGKLMERAMETIEEARAAKKEEKKEVKPTRLRGKDRLYTVPLRTTIPSRRRARIAISNIREFAKKHGKADEVVISKEVNEAIWSHGRKKPPNKIRVVMGEDEDGRIVVKLK